MKIARVNDRSRLPERQPDSAGYDVFAWSDHSLSPGETKIIPIGFHMVLPENQVAFIWDRSGFSSKGIHIFKQMIMPPIDTLDLVPFGGVIDWSYRGQCGVILHSFLSEIITIHHGMKIAQMIIQNVITDDIEEISMDEYLALPPTIRGSGGFGSSDNNTNNTNNTNNICVCENFIRTDNGTCIYCGKEIKL